MRAIRPRDALSPVPLLALLLVGVANPAPAAEASRADDVVFLNSGKVVPADLPFSEAVRVGRLLYLSGQIGVARGARQPVPGGIAAETRQTMENIRTVLETHGYAMKDIVKCTVMLADMADWPAFNEVYKAHFSGRYPARSALGANGLAFGARVEIECIAAAGAD